MKGGLIGQILAVEACFPSNHTRYDHSFVGRRVAFEVLGACEGGSCRLVETDRLVNRMAPYEGGLESLLVSNDHRLIVHAVTLGQWWTSVRCCCCVAAVVKRERSKK